MLSRAVAIGMLGVLQAAAQFVDGTLSDGVNHVPIVGTVVTLVGPARYNAQTDETGAFHIGPVQRGKYTLNIVQGGYILPPERNTPFQVDADLRLVLEMDPLPK